MNVNVSISGVDELIANLTACRTGLAQKTNELCERLAAYGLTLVNASYDGAIYEGEKDVNVYAEQMENGFRIVAEGMTVLILEFGAGVTYGYGHPQPLQYGPGTYPSTKGNWDNPNGWHLPKSKGGAHTYGNAPSITMYNTFQDLQAEVERTAREVFGVS